MPRLLLGICGGIAAYKAAELARILILRGAEVRVVMTTNACRFITPLTLEAITQQKVSIDLFEEDISMPHIAMARWPENIVIAPASAQMIAKISHGFADDLLSTICLATQAPITIAPAMNQAMWLNVNTQDNLQRLKSLGVHIIEPDVGVQACGETGPGRLAEPEAIAHECLSRFDNKTLANQRWVITAGPTREAIDPVRYISNHSSGKMGFALAAEAAKAGAEVILISGPTTLATPNSVQRFDVISAEEMLQVCLKQAQKCDVFIGAAAVSDYAPLTSTPHKIKKQTTSMTTNITTSENTNQNSLTLNLCATQDILMQVRQHCCPGFIIGFAAETEKIVEHARGKLHQKQLDMVIANDVLRQDAGFNHDNNEVVLIDSYNTIALPIMSKTQLAKQLVTVINERTQRKWQARNVT